MITIQDELPAGVIVMEAIGKVTRSDYQETIIPELERAFAFGEKVRFLYLLGDEFEGFEPSALIDDAKLGLKHMGDFERIAVVCDVRWVRQAVRFLGLITAFPIKTFAQGEQEAAMSWLQS